MQTEEDYNQLLGRLRESLPETITAQTRFKIPEPEVLYEGKTTVLRNYGDIVDAINRESSHLIAFLLKEVGTAGNQEGRRAIFKGRVPVKQLQDRITNYVDIYVLCSECCKPDTKIIHEHRLFFMKCEACGAKHPISKI